MRCLELPRSRGGISASSGSAGDWRHARSNGRISPSDSSKAPGEVMALVRRPIVALLVAACVLPAAACDKLPLPRKSDGRALPESLPPVTPPLVKPAKAKPAVTEDPALAAGRFARIQSQLRRLVAAEETFYAENG